MKTGYYFELSTPETMILLGITESKITKDKNGENLLHLEILLTIIINRIQQSCINLFQVNHLVHY